MCPYYILEFRNTKWYLLQVYVGTWAKIELSSKIMSVELLVIVIIVFKHYPCYMV